METNKKREAWNKGKLVGQKPPLKPKDVDLPWQREARQGSPD